MGIWRRLTAFLERARGAGVEDADPRDRAQRDVDFTIAVVALGAKLAKADGHVTPVEHAAFHSAFHTAPESTAEADAAFSRAGQTTLGFEAYAAQLARRWRAFPCLLEDVLDGLFHIAAADGVVTEEEVAYLARVAALFGLSEREFARLMASWIGGEAADPYLILGVDPDISDLDLKKAYRRMAAANHPDTFAARGLPASAAALAHDKMTAVNAAYQRIRRERGLDGVAPSRPHGSRPNGGQAAAAN